MVARVLAFCLNASDHLNFTRGLCVPDEPDLWEHSLDQQLLLWIDVGEPSVERLKKARRKAQRVKVYSFNSKSEVWWRQQQNQMAELDIEVFQFPWQAVQDLAKCLHRTTALVVTVSGGALYVAIGETTVEVHCVCLQQ
jgi:uncharacterized protein YaeQ